MPLFGNMTMQQCTLLLITGFSMGGVTALYDHVKTFIENKKLEKKEL